MSVHLRLSLLFGVPIVGFRAGDFLDEIALQVGPFFCEIDRRRVGNFFGGQHAAQRALGAQPKRERARVDAGQAGNVVALQVGIERLLAAPTADDGGKLAHDQAGDVGLARLDIERVDAGVADERIGHRHDLPLIRRIGQDFLITGHRRVETNFAVRGQAARRTTGRARCCRLQGREVPNSCHHHCDLGAKLKKLCEKNSVIPSLSRANWLNRVPATHASATSSG